MSRRDSALLLAQRRRGRAGTGRAGCGPRAGLLKAHGGGLQTRQDPQLQETGP